MPKHITLIAAAMITSAAAFAQTAHKQAVPVNFGLSRPQDSSTLPYSRSGIVFPKRVAFEEPHTSLRPLGDNSWAIEDGWVLCEQDSEERYNATVPSTVLTTLVRQGVYPDPYFGVNNMAIPDDLCRKQWWYRTDLDLSGEMLSKEKLELIFEGINYRADVWFNSVRLGSIKGAFIRGRFDITKLAREYNHIEVHIFPPQNPGIPHEESSLAGSGPNGGVLCLDGPTFISSEGWDWVPGVRDRNIGIWQNVVLKVSGGITIGDTRVITDLPLPSVDKADVTIETTISNSLSENRQVRLQACLAGRKIEKSVNVPSGASVPVILCADEFRELALDKPKLWWPNGYGEQNLYTLTLSAEVDGKCSDTQDTRFGVRELSYEMAVCHEGAPVRIEFNPTDLRGGTDIFNNRLLLDMGDKVSIPSLREGADIGKLTILPSEDDMGPYLVIKVNGVRIYCKGGNWGMDDMMKNCTREHLEPYMQLHKEAGFNMVRNWTGENTEEVFYNLCDEYGMLVWNDFWLSTEGYNLDVTDEVLFMKNATDVVRRFRNHPSIAIWCPRNEGYATESLEKDLAAMIASEDGTRHYHPNSRYCNLKPSGGWSYFRNASEYFTKMAKGFNTEQGSPSVPTARTMKKFLSPEDQWPISEAWRYHDLHPGTDTYIRTVSELYGEATDIDDFCKKVQLMNYDSYRAMFESWNSRLWHNTSGMLLWMTHPAWPSVEWQCYSYDYETFGSWFGCKKACESLHVQMNLDDDTVCVVNATMKDAVNLKAEVALYTLEGKRVFSQAAPVKNAPANSRVNVFTAELPSVAGVCIARVTLKDSKGRMVSINDYLRTGGKDFTDLNKLPVITLKLRKLSGDRIEVLNPSGTACAISVKINLLDAAGQQILPAYFSDGYFNLLPGEKRVLDYKYNGTGAAGFDIEGYNVTL
ncbi:MAG: glycoside hydrolase family 2 [Bacteroidales bacterium]|nr:glycoside hydrolase family 2 [Bacteroidales bacterium]